MQNEARRDERVKGRSLPYADYHIPVFTKTKYVNFYLMLLDDYPEILFTFAVQKNVS
jgi:hypothetical protein